MAAAGNRAGTGSTELALLTGAGWETLYLDGPLDNAPEANDNFFASLITRSRHTLPARRVRFAL